MINPRKNPFVNMSKEKRVKNARKSNSNKKPDGYIYIFKLVGFEIYKIGSSSDVRRRLRDIRSSQAFDVKIVGKFFFKNVYNMEECIHDSLKNNIHRNEWFKIIKEDVDLICSQLNKWSEDGIFLERRNLS